MGYHTCKMLGQRRECKVRRPRLPGRQVRSDELPMSLKYLSIMMRSRKRREHTLQAPVLLFHR